MQRHYSISGGIMRLFFLVAALAAATTFQGCGSFEDSPVQFAGEPSVQDRFGDVDCITFASDQNLNCKEQTHGWFGSLYYLQDRTDGVTRPETLFDRMGNEVPFNSDNLDSVNVILETGFEANYKVLMPEIFVPSRVFSDGFEIANGEFVADKDGKTLVEAFALDLKTQLNVGERAPGRYAFAIISDDGSLLDVDRDGDGNYESLVENDGYHSPQLKCSTGSVVLTKESRVNLRLRYYQGPRNVIALTLLMKKVNSVNFEVDELCGIRASGGGFRFFGADPTPGYVPELEDSNFGDLIRRGWFVPTQDMFLIPEEL